MLECTQEMACQWVSGQVISLQHIPHQLGEKNNGKQQQQKNRNLQEVFYQSLEGWD